MRLKSVYISQYKNLKNFTMPFDGNSFIDIFVGKNGSGKSNLFEAIIEIFRHLFEGSEINFEYAIKYEIDGQVVDIEWKNGKRAINGNEQKTLGKTPLPDNILIYYSGHNDTIAELVERYEDAFSSRIKTASAGISRRFIGIGGEYKELLLSVLLMQPENNIARQFICQKLGIQEIGAEATLLLKRPSFADNKLEIDTFDAETHYWGAKGVVREFLDKLLTCIRGEFNHASIYIKEADFYKLPINLELFTRKFVGEEASDIFRKLDNLKLLNMLAGITIPLTLTDGTPAKSNQFSDGQFQSVYIYSIIELFKDRNCITLLDEPDAFLHPEWQFDFLKQVFEITDTTAKNNHVLMSSHSALTLTSLQQSHLNVFEILDNTVTVNPFNKDDVIKLLSGNRISLTENETIMSISTFLKNSTQPVLFTEGISDEYILETSWKKLYPGAAKPFCIHNAFDRIFLRNLFSRDELKNNFPNRILCALFDFDEAYDDWNGLKEETIEVNDPFKGLTKKLKKCQNHFAMLLPVPSVDSIKKQVLNPDDQPWGKGPECHLSIELLFYEEELLGTWFTKRGISGGGEIIEFVGDKVRFAQEYVPSLDRSKFEIFLPMFEFIKSQRPA